MGLKEDFKAGTDTAKKMMADNKKGATYTSGVMAVGKEHTPKFLKGGCFPIAIGTVIGVYIQIAGHATEHVIPTITAGVILLGLGKVFQKTTHK